MINKNNSAIILLVILLTLTGCQKNSLPSLAFMLKKTEPAPKAYPDLKIALVDFLPLPDSAKFQLPINRKVMTSEFHSSEDEPDYGKGYFIPEEYQDIILNNIKSWAAVKKINLTSFEELKGIEPKEFDLVILGRTISAKVSDSAMIKVELLVLDGSDFRLLQRRIISHEESKRQSDPIHTPIHFIGEHNDNFCVQRTLLSVTAHHLSEKIFATAFEGRM
ncbi:hypothetical protein [Maridesulfovibrio sp. FT414]|uniref:hypothetical protein n=1 Tax=Maridesulfovibrio sp. FT414 TaxID=2979469 RepID=UPI003D80A1C7